MSQNQKLRAAIRKLVKEEISCLDDEEDLEEVSVTGNVSGFNVPGAFSGEETAKGRKKKGRHGGSHTTHEGGCRKPEVLGYTLVEQLRLLEDTAARVKAIQRLFRITIDEFEKAEKVLPKDFAKVKSIIDTNAYRLKEIVKQVNWLVHRSPEAMQGKNGLQENRWLELKNDTTMNAVQKIGVGIRELNGQLREVESFVRWYKKLQVENDLEGDAHWKRTQRHVHKIKERIINIAKDIQEIM